MPEKNTEKMYESAEKMVMDEAESIETLAKDCVNLIRNDGDLRQGCRDYVNECVLIYTDDREKWLNEYGIETDDPIEKFNEICGSAALHLVNKYIRENNLKIVRDGDAINNARLVGIPKNSMGLEIKNDESHNVLFAFRDDVSIRVMNEFCNEFNPLEIYGGEYGVTVMVNITDDMANYIEDQYDWAISMICDVEQKVNGEPVDWTSKKSVSGIMPIIRCGNSLAINVTRFCETLEVGQGDRVKVTIETE